MKQMIFSGAGSYRQVERILKELDAKKVFLVCGQSFDRQDIAREILTIPYPVIRFSDFGANPLYEDVCKGIILFNKENCDVILAIGGGSAIDTAKCVKLFCRIDPEHVFMEQEYNNTGVPLIAIPTTAGTGSESTRHAVCYYEGKKQSISHPSIVPDYAILEPSLLKKLPAYQKKCTMLDALCQAMESWWSVNSTEESINYSREAIRRILAHKDAYLKESDETAATEMLLGANFAGRAINITATTAAHAMSYKLTSLYRLPHGHAVALCFPEVWEYMNTHPERCIDRRGQQYLLQIFYSIASSLGFNSPTEAVSWFRGLMAELDIERPTAISREEELDILSESVNPVRLKNNPVELDRNVLRSLYNNILL